MKTNLRLVTSFILLLTTSALFSQTVVTNNITYDTSVIGTGSRYPPYQFSFPMFDGTLGTLAEVRISSVLTWDYSYTMENKDNQTVTAKVKVLRSDIIDGPSLMDPLEYDFLQSRPNRVLAPVDGTPNTGSDYFSQPVLHFAAGDTVINETVYNTADYIGIGSVVFEYSPEVGYSVAGANVDFQGQATDQIKMSISYIYSTNAALACDISAFTANKKDNRVNINWRTNNERRERRYELLKSTDGKNFTTITTLNASPNGDEVGIYQFNYVPSATETGKLIFQVKQIETRGATKYSPLRSVDWGGAALKAGIRIFPNPVSGGDVTIAFSDTMPGSYDVQLFNLKGQVVRQMQVTNTAQFKIALGNQLQPGDYFVLARNKSTGEKSVERLVIK